MTFERVVAAAVGVFLLVMARRCALRAHRDLGSPVDVLALYIALWGSVLVLFAIPLIDYSTTPFVAWLAIYGAIAAGAGAAWAVGARDDSAIDPVEDRAAALRARIDPRWLRLTWAICALLGALGLLAFVYAVSRVLPWTAVVTDPEAVRQAKSHNVEFQNTYGLWKLLTYFNQVAFIVWTIGLRVGAFRGRWWWIRFAGVASLAPFLLTADRGLLIASVAWAGALHLIWPQRIALRRAFIVAVAAVLLAGIVVSVVGNRYGGSLAGHPEIAASLTTRVADPVAIPYLYLTGNIPTFGRLTNDPLAPLNLGAMTLLPFAKVASRSGLVERAPVGTGVFYPIPFESFSNYSWLGSFWLDFRLPGVLLLSALTVAITAATHRRATTNPSLAALWITSVLLYVLVFSPFVNALTATLTWQFLLLTPAIVVLIDTRVRGRIRSTLSATSMRNRIAGVGAVFVSIALVGVGVAHLRASSNAASPVARHPDHELELAIVKVRLVFGELGRYPQAKSLATRLHVNRPAVVFHAQASFTEPVLNPNEIAVFTAPQSVILRVRGRDGRLYEAHRTERWGGWTFGPGTRDE